MTEFLSLAPVSVGIYSALNVASLTGAISGKTVLVGDSVPQGAFDVALMFQVSEDAQRGGFGTKPGTAGWLPQVGVRLYAWSVLNQTECQTVIGKAIELLVNPPTVSGFSSWAIFWDSAPPGAPAIIAGVKVQELTANGRLLVELQ